MFLGRKLTRNVSTMKNHDLQGALDANSMVLVEFYAPWYVFRYIHTSILLNHQRCCWSKCFSVKLKCFWIVKKKYDFAFPLNHSKNQVDQEKKYEGKPKFPIKGAATARRLLPSSSFAFSLKINPLTKMLSPTNHN